MCRTNAPLSSYSAGNPATNQAESQPNINTREVHIWAQDQVEVGVAPSVMNVETINSTTRTAPSFAPIGHDRYPMLQLCLFFPVQSSIHGRCERMRGASNSHIATWHHDKNCLWKVIPSDERQLEKFAQGVPAHWSTQTCQASMLDQFAAWTKACC